MKTYFKITKDTPLHNKDTELTSNEFFFNYDWIVDCDIPEGEFLNEIRENIKKGYKYPWFEMIDIEKNNFRIGDCVWHEELREALFVIHHTLDTKHFKPNNVSLEAANDYTDFYKRHATKKEANDAQLVSYHEDRILLGKHKCYYFSNTWKEVTGVHDLLKVYLRIHYDMINAFVEIKNPGGLDPIMAKDVILNGLKIGCLELPHDTIMQMCRQLNLKP